MALPFFVLSLLLCLTVQQCTHPVFCNPTILAAVAGANIFVDSKAFVDLHLTVSVAQALTTFKTKSVEEFVRICFQSADSILEDVELSDYQDSPPSFKSISDPQMLQFAKQLNRRWKGLARRVNLQQRKGSCLEDCTSFLPEIDGAIIVLPGGRFKETYYWDTYWILKGLFACDMLDTAQILVRNFFLVIEKRGFVPNGFRLYYLNRSQPPFLGLMVKELLEQFYIRGMKTRAEQLQKDAYVYLIQEHSYWMRQHSVTIRIQGREFVLNLYNSSSDQPRPESYKEDVKIVEGLVPEEQRRVWKAINTMAESGWDFSSRWLLNSSSIQSSIINQIIPSDLNTLLGLLQTTIASLSAKLGRFDNISYYINMYKARQDYFRLIKSNGSFPDYTLKGLRTPLSVYPSDFYPFLLLSQRTSVPPQFRNVVGPVTSTIRSGLQWDSPNVWAPNNWIMHMVSSLDSYMFAQQWLQTVRMSWLEEGNIYQKYRYDSMGKRGEGGEYQVQVGFGWSNGLALYYLIKYGAGLASF